MAWSNGSYQSNCTPNLVTIKIVDWELYEFKVKKIVKSLIMVKSLIGELELRHLACSKGVYQSNCTRNLVKINPVVWEL